MNDINIDELKKDLKTRLSNERYMHSLGCADTAKRLAANYGIDEDKAYIAGLLHDYSKRYNNEEYLELAGKYNVNITDTNKQAPYLLHGLIGAHELQDKYDFIDEDMFNAITNHTTGRPGMSILEQIIFIADYIEPNREDIPGLDMIRKEAFKNLDNTCKIILQQILDHLKEQGKLIDNNSIDTFNYYKEVTNE